jgi:hypothetical protein
LKAWEKPKLIILVRGRPEEALITDCKSTGTGAPLSDFTSCDQYTTADGPIPCDNCYMAAIS